MAHVARLDSAGVVTHVLVVDNAHDTTPASFDGIEDWAKQFARGVPELANAAGWKQTSYNGNFRKRFAGAGYTYDAARDVFIPPKPSEDAVFDKAACCWESPGAGNTAAGVANINLGL